MVSAHPLRSRTTNILYLVVPAMPGMLLTRLKSLEDHIVRLEKDYPPWAALHFNQPNRGVSRMVFYACCHRTSHQLPFQWPPPPRPTPIIVPPHLRPVQGNT